MPLKPAAAFLEQKQEKQAQRSAAANVGQLAETNSVNAKGNAEANAKANSEANAKANSEAYSRSFAQAHIKLIVDWQTGSRIAVEPRPGSLVQLLRTTS